MGLSDRVTFTYFAGDNFHGKQTIYNKFMLLSCINMVLKFLINGKELVLTRVGVRKMWEHLESQQFRELPQIISSEHHCPVGKFLLHCSKKCNCKKINPLTFLFI
jgi:hypothetical protein